MKVHNLCKVVMAFLFVMSFSLESDAQSASTAQMKVTGIVKDKLGESLVGANVIIENKSKGVVTDADGKFSLEVPEGASLIFSYTGFESKTMKIRKSGFLNVILEDDQELLDEIVVIGYGVQRKKDLTGAVSVIDKDILKNKSATTIADALQGAAAGVYVRGGSAPGQGASIEIRGVNSLTNNSPLYVIDGLLTNGNRDLNPADIESIQILKDASAAAIYGSRAANGVIVITTKKGEEGPMKVNVSLKKGIQVSPRYDLMERSEFIEINDMAYKNADIPVQQHREGINTDWQDETFRTGMVDDYNVSLSGGGQNSRYMISGNYFNNDGTVIGTDFERVSVRINTEAQKGFLKIGENLAISHSKSHELSGNPFWEVLRMLPTIPVYDEANPGGYGYGDGATAKSFGSNPVALSELYQQRNQNLRISGNIYAEAELFKMFKYKLNWGYETSYDNYRSIRKVGNWSMNQPAEASKIYENRAGYYSSIVENTLSFNKNFGKHHVDAVAGLTYQNEKYAIIGAQKSNLIMSGNGYFTVVDAGTSDPQAGGSEQRNVMISYLGRVNYNFDDKYLLSATIRTDGSSKFRKEDRWGTFPSVSAGWRISKEKFFQADFIDDLKVRANYGTLGSVNIGSYDYFALINTNTPAIFGNVINNGATQVKLANSNLKWETLTQQNYGFDLSVLNSRLTLSGEYYISNSKDILYGTPITTSTGNDGGAPVVNAATLKNAGFELSVKWNDKVKDFKYSIGLNATTLKNKVKGLGYGSTEVKTGTTISKIGEPLGMWYLIKTDGLFQNPAEIQNHKDQKGNLIQPDAQPGDIRFIDYNNDGKITNEDRQNVGSPWADFEAGLNFNLEWKNFDLSMNWFASVGGQVFNSPKQLTDRFDDNSNYRKGIKPWQKEGDHGDPRAVYSSTQNSLLETDRWLENGSFLRLKELSIGYNFSKALLKHIHIDQCRVYISGQNLITVTGYEGLDPEFGGALYERGRDFAAYPNALAVSLGLNFTF